MNQITMNNTNTIALYNKVLLTIHKRNELTMPIIYSNSFIFSFSFLCFFYLSFFSFFLIFYIFQNEIKILISKGIGSGIVNS